MAGFSSTGPATARAAMNALAPMSGFGVMLLMLHLAIRPLGVGAAFGLCMLVYAAWSSLLLVLQTGCLPTTSNAASATSLPEG
jgi:hypothetical protein